MTRINTVAIVGGTHGNERTGVALVSKWLTNPTLISRDSFQATALLGNPLAVKKNQRYIDEDLNRAFSLQRLNQPPVPTWEAYRAEQLNQILGPKLAKPKYDFILDLHTTTATMGKTLIIYQQPFNLQLAKFLQTHYPEFNIYLSDKQQKETIGLQSIAPMSALLELGPIAHGIVHHDLFLQMEDITYRILDFIDQMNQEKLHLTGKLEVYRRGDQVIPYPKNSCGEINGMIHRDLQDRNFLEIRQGDPLFVTYDGDVLSYQQHPGYPVFINEAAYCEKDIAFRLSKKTVIELN